MGASPSPKTPAHGPSGSVFQFRRDPDLSDAFRQPDKAVTAADQKKEITPRTIERQISDSIIENSNLIQGLSFCADSRFRSLNCIDGPPNSVATALPIHRTPSCSSHRRTWARRTMPRYGCRPPIPSRRNAWWGLERAHVQAFLPRWECPAKRRVRRARRAGRRRDRDALRSTIHRALARQSPQA